MKILLTNSQGKSLCGTDGAFHVDGRFGPHRMAVEIDNYRQSFKKNFPHKYEYWTHFGVVSSFRADPTTVYKIA